MPAFSLLFIYAFIMLIAGYFLARNRNVQDFLIAGRSNPGWVMAAGIAVAWVDAFWFIFYSGIGYSMGWGCLFLVAGIISGFLMLSAYTDKIKTISTEHNMITFTDWFRYKYGRPMGIVVGIAVSLLFMGWLICVLIGAGMAMSTVFNLPYKTMILIMALFVLPLILKGGYAGLTKLDVLQFFIVFGLWAYVFIFGFKPDVKN